MIGTSLNGESKFQVSQFFPSPSAGVMSRKLTGIWGKVLEIMKVINEYVQLRKFIVTIVSVVKFINVIETNDIWTKLRSLYQPKYLQNMPDFIKIPY